MGSEIRMPRFLSRSRSVTTSGGGRGEGVPSLGNVYIQKEVDFLNEWLPSRHVYDTPGIPGPMGYQAPRDF
jgi:hypothetical protein